MLSRAGQVEAQAADAPLPTGRLLVFDDIGPHLKGRQAEVGSPPHKPSFHVLCSIQAVSRDPGADHSARTGGCITAVVLAGRSKVVPGGDLQPQSQDEDRKVSAHTTRP